MNNNRYHRQILAFGEEGQRKIAASHVGVVGVGGIGSQVVQALAYLGVGTFTLVDDDIVDSTNLNRLVGAVPLDAEVKTPKVEVAVRHIQQINPDACAIPVPKNLRTRRALEALLACPVIFGCVDHDGPRLILMELAAAYAIIYIDAATEIPPPDGGPLTFGGRVVVARPAEFCLDCARQIDMEQAKWELASPATRETRRAHGYGLGEAAPAPAVISLNGVVANLAVTGYLALTTGIGEIHRHVIYYGDRGKVNVRGDDRRTDCFTCGYLVGQRDKANIFRYVCD